MVVDFDKHHLNDVDTQVNWNRKVLYVSVDLESSTKSTDSNNSKMGDENDERFTVNISMNKVLEWN